MTGEELLRRMPHALDADAARGIEATIQYEIGATLHQVLAEGRLTTFDGPATRPNLVVEVREDDLVRLFRRELDPMRALMTGRLRVRGDVGLARRLVRLVDPDRLGDPPTP